MVKEVMWESPGCLQPLPWVGETVGGGERQLGGDGEGSFTTPRNALLRMWPFRAMGDWDKEETSPRGQFKKKSEKDQRTEEQTVNKNAKTKKKGGERCLWKVKSKMRVARRGGTTQGVTNLPQCCSTSHDESATNKKSLPKLDEIFGKGWGH